MLILGDVTTEYGTNCYSMWEKERVAECKPKNKKRGRLGTRSYIANITVTESVSQIFICDLCVKFQVICGCYAAYTDMPHKSTYAHPTIYLLCIRLVLLAAISRMEKCANNVNTVHARTLEHGYLVPTFCSWFPLTLFLGANEWIKQLPLFSGSVLILHR